jgi:hypothetical protein
VRSDPWYERFATVDGDPALAGGRSFVRVFEPDALPCSARVVARDGDAATAYLVRAGERPRLVESAADAELLFGSLPDLVHGLETGEWREIPDFVPTALLQTAAWVVMTACLRGG